MNINRNNYEEYFLLYIDNELSLAERREVEDFTERNTDLQHELRSLQQSTIKPDKNILFPDKESLMQLPGGEACINVVNFEQYFILYADNELSQEEKAAVELFVYQHPQFQESFELIQELRFTPDLSIAFPDKKSLYHSESREPVIFPWWRIAAAAVIMLIAGPIWLNPDPVQVPVKSVAEVSTKKPVENPSRAITEPDVVVVDSKDIASTSPVAEPSPDSRNIKQLHKPVQADHPVKQDVANVKASDKLEKAEVNDPSSNKTAEIAGITPEKISGPVADLTLTDQPSSGSNVGSPVKEAMFAMAEPAEDENTFLTNISISKKSPVSRAFRKASRFIQKNTDLGLARKTGIQIGNIEIAFQ